MAENTMAMRRSSTRSARSSWWMTLALFMTKISRPGCSLSALTSTSSGWPASREFSHSVAVSVVEKTTFSTASIQAPRSRTRAGMLGSRVMPGHTA